MLFENDVISLRASLGKNRIVFENWREQLVGDVVERVVLDQAFLGFGVGVDLEMVTVNAKRAEYVGLPWPYLLNQAEVLNSTQQHPRNH